MMEQQTTTPNPTNEPSAPAVLPQTRPSRGPLIIALAFGIAMTVLFLLLPAIYHARYQLLLWSEGIPARAFGQGFLSGHLQKLIETPNPLWNLFWLLGSMPNQLFVLLGIMFGVMCFFAPYISNRLAGSVWPGVLAMLLAVFGFKEILGLMLAGNWILPYALLGLIFLFALIDRRWILASVMVGLMGLIRPESWLLAVFLFVYVIYLERKVRWYTVLPMLAPLAWGLFDLRASGDFLFTYHQTVANALFMGLPSINFINFWPRLLGDITDSTGILVLLYALVAIIIRARNVARETRRSRFWAVVLDPLFAVTLLPLIAAWISSLQGDIAVMRWYLYPSIALLTLYALLLPTELFRNRKVANRAVLTGAIWLPLLLVGLVRLPANGGNAHRALKVTESKMAAIQSLAVEFPKAVPDLSQYRHILIPSRRYAQFQRFMGDSLAAKFLSYRELSIAVTSAQEAMMGYELEAPRGSPRYVLDLIDGRRGFNAFLPSVALWIPDDEQLYINAFSFDDPDYFHRNYIDHGRYGFRIIGAALDSLGLIYDVREISPDMIRSVAPAPEPNEEPPLEESLPAPDRP